MFYIRFFRLFAYAIKIVKVQRKDYNYVLKVAFVVFSK